MKLQQQYSNNFLFGVRYAFNVARAGAGAGRAGRCPAAAPARSYLVFFDWDKATLTDRARQIIKEAADNSTRVQYTRIEVNGYTDTSGTPQYNQGLSVRRAQAVQAELIKDGVPRQCHHHSGLRRNASAGADRAWRSRTAEPAGRDHHPLTKRRCQRGGASHAWKVIVAVLTLLPISCAQPPPGR